MLQCPSPSQFAQEPQTGQAEEGISFGSKFEETPRGKSSQLQSSHKNIWCKCARHVSLSYNFESKIKFE
eukprot:s2682_g11.t1